MPPLTAKQLEERKHYLGSSDAAAVLGLSRYHTALEVWAVKTGNIEEEDVSSKLPVKLGHKMEPIVADLFEEATGKKLRKVNETIYHPQFPFLAANIDRRIVGEDSAVECKAVSAWRAREFEDDEYPAEMLAQVCHQMAVTDKSSVWLAVLVGNQDFRYKEVMRDEKVIDEMVRREVHFWETFVVPGVMPMQISCNDNDTLLSLFPEAMPEHEIVLTDEANRLIEEIQAHDQEIDSLEGMVGQKKNLLKAMLGEAEAGATGLYRVTWKNSQRTTVDGTRLKAERPEVYEAYKSVSKFRQLKYRAIKEEA